MLETDLAWNGLMAKTGERPKILIDRSINIFGRDYQELSVKIVDRQIAYQTDDDDDDDDWQCTYIQIEIM